MNQRNNQEDKFKNIILKVEPAKTHSPDLATSHGVRPTFSPTNQTAHRPSPRHQPSITNHLEISTSNVLYRPFGQSSGIENGYEVRHRNVLYSDNIGRHSQTLITSQIRQNDQSMVSRLQAQITQKQQIIAELKGLIKISNQNSMKGMRSASLLARNGLNQDQHKQIEDLKHNVKILTIQNNTLSDYIDKLKKTIGTKPVQYSDSRRQKASDNNDIAYKTQISRLNQVISDLQSNYDKKIDQFIASHKSLAQQCKSFQHAKEAITFQNQKLKQRIQQLQVFQNKHFGVEEKKNNSVQKFSVHKIKQQYTESLRQFKQIVSIQTQHLFDQFRSRLQNIADNISHLNQKIFFIENYIKQRNLIISRQTKKSEIYIEEGVDSSSISDSSKKQNKESNSNCKPLTISQLYDDLRQNEQQLTHPLNEEILRLKSIISELESEVHQRNEFYNKKNNLRESQQEMKRIKGCNQIKEKVLLQDIDKLKAEINRLQKAYRKQKDQSTAQLNTKDELLSNTLSKLHNLKLEKDILLEESRKNRDQLKQNKQLEHQNKNLREQLGQCIIKIQQYKKLCLVLKDESEQNSVQLEIFHQLKDRIYKLQKKYHIDLERVLQMEKQQQHLLTVNKDMKLKLQQALNKNISYNQYEKIANNQMKKIQRQNQQLKIRIEYQENTIRSLQKQLKLTIEVEKKWQEEKKELQKQIVGYLNLFHKISLDDSKTTRKSPQKNIEQKEIQQLLNKVSQLEASFSEINSSRRQKQQKIIRMINDPAEWKYK